MFFANTYESDGTCGEKIGRFLPTKNSYLPPESCLRVANNMAKNMAKNSYLPNFRKKKYA